MDSLSSFTLMNKNELEKINGGKIIWVAIAEEAYRHSDQIIKGFRKAQKKYR
ncbi:hypothetical protein LOOC260_107500 [Paucilactobacillus hokkaidonensis JCM 18461]|uniref:Bacteriocin n=1 Tax=Paucilactobacillus hokkaidonensis JCM 18461 TaxID=1291742 RepID=A0A0A1GTG8_9LACO|nr:bacteriocin [Paucilactobacillus hokkaidonensis]BAP85290.1 hypothetical protein LOOC260_107500 [Paucilactobacillus hokkaidonensis JCM 18461]